VRDLAELALDAARTAGASYAEARVGRGVRESLTARDETRPTIERSESRGLGVRVLVDGAWGFAAGPSLGRDEIARVSRLACDTARASRIVPGRIVLAPVAAHLDAWQTPMTKDPFKAGIGRKIDILLAINKAALEVKGASFVRSFLIAASDEEFLATSEGTRLDLMTTRLWPGFTVTALDAATGEWATRDGDIPPAQRGLEYLEEIDLDALAARAAEEAIRKLRAPAVTPGTMDLVVHPSSLWLAIHETVARPLEYDRALGDEEDPSPGGPASIGDVGSLRYGSDRMSVTADRTLPGGLATIGYDDEGVPAGSWPLVTRGLLAGFATTRAYAGAEGFPASSGCARAEGWSRAPLLRMPNVSLEPSESPTSLEDLIGDVEEGLYVEGLGAWAINPARTAFQIGADYARTIRRGRLGPPVKDAAYRSGTLDFWRSLEALGGEATWGVGGTFNDGKGEPPQMSPVSHGAPAARFRRVRVVPAGGA